MLKNALLLLLSGTLITGFTFLNPFGGFDEITPPGKVFYEKNGNPNWLVIREDVYITAEAFIRQQKIHLELGTEDELVLYRTDADALGFRHYRYQHYHRGIKVEGSELLVHEKDGYVQTANGKLVRGLDMNIQSLLTKDEAITLALNRMPATKYMWESDAAERLLKRVRKDPDATYYPAPEEVWIDPAFGQRAEACRLAYRLTIHAMQPHSRKLFYIDAVSGEILQEINMMHTQQVQNEPGVAETKYSGTQDIIADSLQANQYRLRETARGGGIETYDMNQGDDFGQADDFLDDDNYWNNVNDEQDEAATDAHWGAEMTFDYFLEEHDHSGLDGNNFPLISYVHVFENWFNASWNGTWVSYGDGNPPNSSALTALDVAGHEYAHGITDFTSDLIYQNESGALNESFSDIFGAAIEFWATPDQADWYIGEDFMNSALRNMSDPHEFDHPDTYKGEFWVTGTFDNGGVHTNSGVQNYWFYLLSEGGSGTNDNFDDYQVDSIGIKDAAKIAFRNQKYYLSRFSEYEDAREGSLQAAADLFGLCSENFKQTAKAWYAVGVGAENFASDFKIAGVNHPQELFCGPATEEFITVTLVYRDCETILEPGEKIPMAYQINEEPVVWDTFSLTGPVQAGDTIQFTYPTPVIQFATPGTYKLRVWSDFPQDVIPGNNILTLFVETALDESNDIGSTNMQRPIPGCFLGQENVEMEIAFFGCDSVPAGSVAEVFYSINNGTPVSEFVEIPYTLYRGDRFTHTFSNTANLTAGGFYQLDAWTKLPGDLFPGNDSLPVQRVLSPVEIYNMDIVTFEADQASLDSFFYVTNEETEVFISTHAAKKGKFGLQITGGDVLKEFENDAVDIPNNDNVWNINPKFRTKVCFCADLSGLPDAELRFGLKQTYSPLYDEFFDENLPFASAARVLVNGEQISFNYKPSTYTSDPYQTRKFNLEDFLGGPAEICFEFATLFSKELDPFDIGDNAYIDDVTIISSLTGTNDLRESGLLAEVFPNPSEGMVQIDLQATRSADAGIRVIDTRGQVILSRSVQVNQGVNRIEADLSAVPSGVYFLQIQSGEEQIVKEVVIF